jgi:hypothetical protein
VNSGQGIRTLSRHRAGFLLGLFYLLLTQTSCQQSHSTSIVVVAVDSLSVGDISCTQRQASRSGLVVLCEDSIRFTHAYTPSTMSAPTLASLLTGLYPFQHGLHNNGSPGLPSSFQSVAESAVEKKYRTGFFSGGAPIFRKTGLNQGFEVFDDGFVPSLQQIYKPFKKNIDAFEVWLSQEVKHDPFIAYFYVPDLNFIDTVTVSPTGETRSRTYDSQLEELDTQLLHLIRVLKKRDQWRETMFVFTGLNGRIINPRLEEFPPLNVHVENTQVPLFIKPPQKVRDTNLHWTIDRNVSLVDVGATLFDVVGDKIPTANANFPIFSLKNSIVKIDALPPEDRAILMESGWAQWHKTGGLRAATINNQDYVVYDQKPKYFNLLTDRLELNPLVSTKSNGEEIKKTTEALHALGYEPFHFSSDLNEEKFAIPFLTWVDPLQTEYLKQSLHKIYQENKKDTEIINWLAAISLETKDWALLKDLADKANNKTWLLAVQTHQDNDEKINDACWDLVSKPTLDNSQLKNCQDKLFREMLSWIKADGKDPTKDWLKSRFIKSYQNALVDRKILKANMALSEIWDVPADLLLHPTLTDLYLNRPENQSLKTALMHSMPREEEEY